LVAGSRSELPVKIFQSPEQVLDDLHAIGMSQRLHAARRQLALQHGGYNDLNAHEFSADFAPETVRLNLEMGFAKAKGRRVVPAPTAAIPVKLQTGT
jgi:hypothetical protein